MTRWEHFEHDADVGIRGLGATPEAAFEQAALALTAVVCDPERVKPRDPVTLRCNAPDIELLFVDFINAVIYEMATRRMLFGRYQVALDGDNNVEATGWGEPVDRQRHALGVEPKGATYTCLDVREKDDGTWLAQCIVDV